MREVVFPPYRRVEGRVGSFPHLSWIAESSDLILDMDVSFLRIILLCVVVVVAAIVGVVVFSRAHQLHPTWSENAVCYSRVVNVVETKECLSRAIVVHGFL